MCPHHSHTTGVALAPYNLPCPIQGADIKRPRRVSSGYLKDCLHQDQQPQTFPSTEGVPLCVPPVEEARMASTKGRAFLVDSPHLRCSLPRDNHLALPLVSCRHQVKTAELYRGASNETLCSPIPCTVWFRPILVLLERF